MSCSALTCALMLSLCNLPPHRDGFRMEVADQVNRWLQAPHTLFLGTQMREFQYVYQFGLAFQNEDQRTVWLERVWMALSTAGSSRRLPLLLRSKHLQIRDLKDAVRNMHHVVQVPRPETGQGHARDQAEKKKKGFAGDWAWVRSSRTSFLRRCDELDYGAEDVWQAVHTHFPLLRAGTSGGAPRSFSSISETRESLRL